MIQNDDDKERCFINRNYEIYEVDVYENELLYLPGYWYHEVTNNNFSCAISMWWKSKDEIYADEILSYRVPLVLNTEQRSLAAIYEFLYFIQKLIDKWCKVIKEKYNDQYALKCLEYENHGFLLGKFR